jgi:hypothetical protein
MSKYEERSYACGCIVGQKDSVLYLEYCPMHKATPKLLTALKELLKVVKGDGKRKHHNLCYGLDVEAHPDCELCKSIAVERIGYKAVAEAEGK